MRAVIGRSFLVDVYYYNCRWCGAPLMKEHQRGSGFCNLACQSDSEIDRDRQAQNGQHNFVLMPKLTSEASKQLQKNIDKVVRRAKKQETLGVDPIREHLYVISRKVRRLG